MHHEVNITTATTTTSVLMPLSLLAGVSKFCSNFLPSFLSIVRIPSSMQAILFQVLLDALFPQFPWLHLVSFPSDFNFHNLTYLRFDVLTHEMTIPPQASVNDHILNLHNITSQRSHVSQQYNKFCLTKH